MAAGESLRLGFGASGAWAQPWFEAATAAALVRKAVDLGVRHFDTAPFYAEGEAERRLGEALPPRDGLISTKTGTIYRRFGPALKDFSEGRIRADVESSLRRLRRDRLDLLYLHGPNEVEIVAARPVLLDLKKEGKIGAWGVCGSGAPLAAAVDAGADAIMGVYNVLNRDHAAVFRAAKARGAMVVAIAPLAQGLYRRGFLAPRSPADAWHVARALVRNRDALARARALRPALESVDGWTAAEVALAFTLANADIDLAMTTTTKAAHLEESARAARKSPPEAALARLAALDAEGGGA